MDVRKALRRFCGFFEGKWETINGRPPSPGGYAVSPFLKMGMRSFARHATDDTWWRWTFILQLLARTLDFLRCSPSTESINNAILKWNAAELEAGRSGGGTRSGHGADERGISSRTSIHRGPLRKCR